VSNTVNKPKFTNNSNIVQLQLFHRTDTKMVGQNQWLALPTWHLVGQVPYLPIMFPYPWSTSNKHQHLTALLAKLQRITKLHILDGLPTSENHNSTSFLTTSGNFEYLEYSKESSIEYLSLKKLDW